MNPAWYPVIGIAAINLIAVAAMWGGAGRHLTELDRRVEKIEDDVDTDSKLQWAHINATETSLANVRGQLGLNGGK